MAGLGKEFLEILRCPYCVGRTEAPPTGVSKGQLREDGGQLVCLQCGRRYPIEDGIPDMIVEHAKLPGGAEISARA